jgi:hypothetical protein
MTKSLKTMFYPFSMELGCFFLKKRCFSMDVNGGWTTTCKKLNIQTGKNGPKITLFGRKTGVSREKNDIVRSCCSTFARLVCSQADDSQSLARIEAITKKYAKKPTVGFLFFVSRDIIFA